MTSLESIVGANVAAHREAAGLSQAQLAERLGVQKQTVFRWEHGQTLPTGSNFAALGDVFGVEPWTLCVPSKGKERSLTRAQEARVREALAVIRQALGLSR